LKRSRCAHASRCSTAPADLKTHADLFIRISTQMWRNSRKILLPRSVEAFLCYSKRFCFILCLFSDLAFFESIDIRISVADSRHCERDAPPSHKCCAALTFSLF
jgi:hypothetical protein